MRGSPPFAPPAMALRASGGVPCRGPAGPRGRVPVWPSSAARVGPRAAMRGVGCPNPPRYAQQIRTAPRRVSPRPHGGRWAPWRGLAGFAPACLSAAIPSRLGCWWWSWAVLASLPRRRGPLHEDAGGGRGSPAPGLLFLRAFSPPGFFSPAPCILAGGPAFSPSPWLSLVVPALCMAARRGRAAPPLRAARYTEGAEDGENERRTDRPRREALPPARGLVPCATSFAIEPLRPYRISGSTANTPAPGNGRKGTAARKG